MISPYVIRVRSRSAAGAEILRSMASQPDWTIRRRPLLAALAGKSRDAATTLVFTPNIQHVVGARLSAQTYSSADVLLADGWPVALVCTALRGRWVSRLPGSWLLEALCKVAHEEGLPVALVGGSPGSAERAAKNLASSYPGLDIVTREPAPAGLVDDPDASERFLNSLAQDGPRITFVGFGYPRQEQWLLLHRNSLPCGLFIACGASIDFAAGARRRAPVAWQKLGVEWLYRILQEPRRLIPRYLDAVPSYCVAAIRAYLGFSR